MYSVVHLLFITGYGDIQVYCNNFLSLDLVSRHDESYGCSMGSLVPPTVTHSQLIHGRSGEESTQLYLEDSTTHWFRNVDGTWEPPGKTQKKAGWLSFAVQSS